MIPWQFRSVVLPFAALTLMGGSTALAQRVVYVNDGDTAGDIITTAIGQDGAEGTASAPVRTLAEAITLAGEHGTVIADAGTFVVDQLLTIPSGQRVLGLCADASTIVISASAPSTITLESHAELSRFSVTREVPTEPGGQTMISLLTAIGAKGIRITDNVFTGNRTSVYVTEGFGHVVARNVFRENRTGLLFAVGGVHEHHVVANNSFEQNRTFGIIFLDGSTTSAMVIRDNTFVGNGTSGLEYNAEGRISVLNNWFGERNPVTTTMSVNGGFAVDDHAAGDQPPYNFVDLNGPDVEPNYPNHLSGNRTDGMDVLHARRATSFVANCGLVTSSSPMASYPTIQAAIDGSVTGAVITVPAQPWEESGITVSKDVTIRGAGPKAVIRPRQSVATLGEGTMWSTAFIVTSPGVVIRNLAIDGTNPTLPGGVELDGLSMHLAHGMVVDAGMNRVEARALTVRYLTGTALWYTGRGANAVIRGNEIADVANGIVLQGTDATIDGNTVINARARGILTEAAAGAFRPNVSPRVTIAGNTIVVDPRASHGMLLTGVEGGSAVTDNVILAAGDGVGNTGITLSRPLNLGAIPSVVIAGNTVEGLQYGITTDRGNANGGAVWHSITGNTVVRPQADVPSVGILVSTTPLHAGEDDPAGAVWMVLGANTVNGSTEGIRVEQGRSGRAHVRFDDGNTLMGTGTGLVVDGGRVVIENATVGAMTFDASVGTYIALASEALAGATLDARSAIFSDQCDDADIEARLVHDRDDASVGHVDVLRHNADDVSGNVIYVDAATGDDGRPGQSADVLVCNGPLRTITAALARVNDGGTVYVAAGTYDDVPMIDRPVTLVGDGTTTLGGHVTVSGSAVEGAAAHGFAPGVLDTIAVVPGGDVDVASRLTGGEVTVLLRAGMHGPVTLSVPTTLVGEGPVDVVDCSLAPAAVITAFDGPAITATGNGDRTVRNVELRAQGTATFGTVPSGNPSNVTLEAVRFVKDGDELFQVHTGSPSLADLIVDGNDGAGPGRFVFAGSAPFPVEVLAVGYGASDVVHGSPMRLVDRSGRHLDLVQNAAPNRPVVVQGTLGGRPALSFGGVGHRMASVSGSIAMPAGVARTTVVVFEPGSRAGFARQVVYKHGSEVSGVAVILNPQTSQVELGMWNDVGGADEWAVYESFGYQPNTAYQATISFEGTVGQVTMSFGPMFGAVEQRFLSQPTAGTFVPVLAADAEGANVAIGAAVGRLRYATGGAKVLPGTDGHFVGRVYDAYVFDASANALEGLTCTLERYYGGVSGSTKSGVDGIIAGEASLSTTIAPQPVIGMATATVSVPASDMTSIDVVDMTGTVVRTLHDGQLAAGTVEVALDGTALVPGSYLLRVRQGGEQSVQPFVIVR